MLGPIIQLSMKDYAKYFKPHGLLRFGIIDILNNQEFPACFNTFSINLFYNRLVVIFKYQN